MSEQTPETDAKWQELLCCSNLSWHDIAENIKADCQEKDRERDEAREAWYEMQSSFERSRDEVEKLIRERDEAREIARESLRLFKHDKKHLCDSHRDMRGNCIVCQMEETK